MHEMAAGKFFIVPCMHGVAVTEVFGSPWMHGVVAKKLCFDPWFNGVARIIRDVDCDSQDWLRKIDWVDSCAP